MDRDHITLDQCTKSDLRWIINRILKMTSIGGESYYLDRALNDLWYEKEIARIDEAKIYANLSDTKMREYIDLLAPYDGIPLINVPIEVINKADKAFREACAADKKWRKLMGLENGKQKEGTECQKD